MPDELLPDVEAEEEDEPFVDYDAQFEDPQVDGLFWRPWWTPFLKSLATIGVITDAAKAAGVSPQFARRDAKKHEQFRVRWHDAQEIANDLIRRTIRVRGTIGQDETVTTVATREELDDGGKVIARITTTTTTTKKSPSNAVLIRAAQAHCPEYRTESVVRHGGIPGEEPPVVEIRDKRRTPERVAELAEALLELGIPLPGQAAANGSVSDD